MEINHSEGKDHVWQDDLLAGRRETQVEEHYSDERKEYLPQECE